MLTIPGHSQETFCDGISRRNFLRIGSLGMGGLAMPELLKAQHQSGNKSAVQKSIIMIFLPGGPPHQDMWDIKMDAPAEIRGEFSPIGTNVPGIQICEHFPRIAKMADKMTFIRSIVGASGDHDAYQCMTGRPPRRNLPPGGWPSIGSAIAKIQGPVNEAMPPFVGLAPKMGEMRWADPGRPGFLGPKYAPFQPNGGGKQDMMLNGISLDRLNDRAGLLKSFDQFRRETDASGMMEGMDEFSQQAFGVLTSSKLANALNIDDEDASVRAAYGKGLPANVADGGPRLMEQFLMARRLVESGVRCVTLAFSRWDWHGGNFRRGRQDMPMLDKGVSALVTDLHSRGLDKDVTVIVWGEFGRTPTINKDGGRDHWPRVSCALMAGGGMNHGQVIGATDRLGGEATERPVHFQEVHATLYNRMGIDIRGATVDDLGGRPRYLVDQDANPISELIG
ncbi:MAG: hypothetical protein ACI9R3_003972 [Verrucomicrobiales bacterium]|jgi:hypothetical protein